jgi:ATP-dependent RNA helicase RhlE
LPLLQHLSKERKGHVPQSPRALILAPTRELAVQIDESLRTYGRHLKLRHAVILGGVNQHRQVQAMRGGVDVLVATPGTAARSHQPETCKAEYGVPGWSSMRPTACSTWASSAT